MNVKTKKIFTTKRITVITQQNESNCECVWRMNWKVECTATEKDGKRDEKDDRLENTVITGLKLNYLGAAHNIRKVLNSNV